MGTIYYFLMEAMYPDKLPFVTSKKPFYINRGFVVPPSFYNQPSPSPLDTFPNSLDSSRFAKRTTTKVKEMRSHIQRTIEKHRHEKALRNDIRKGEEGDNLQRKKAWVLQQKRRHEVLMAHMREYLETVRKAYLSGVQCGCGCRATSDPSNKQNQKKTSFTQLRVNTEEKQSEQQEAKSQGGTLGMEGTSGSYCMIGSNYKSCRNSNARSSKEREESAVDMICYKSKRGSKNQGKSMFRFNKIAQKTHLIQQQGHFAEQSETRNTEGSLAKDITHSSTQIYSSTQNQSSTLTHMHSLEMKSQYVQLSEEYFSMMGSLEKKAHLHLINHKGIEGMLKKLLSQEKPAPSHGIHLLGVLSLTKQSWEEMFLGVIKLKEVEESLLKSAEEHSVEVVYSQEESIQKKLLDELYAELQRNECYFRHIKSRFLKGKESKEEYQKARQQAKDSQEQKHRLERVSEEPPNEAEQKKQAKKRGSQRRDTESSQLNNRGSSNLEELGTIEHGAEGYKISIHDRFDNSILELMKNQVLITYRNKPNRVTLLQQFELQHLVKRSGERGSERSSLELSSLNLEKNGADGSRLSSKKSSFLNPRISRDSLLKRSEKRSTITKKKSPDNKTPEVLREESFDSSLELDLESTQKIVPEVKKIEERAKRLGEGHLINNMLGHPLKISPLEEQSTLKNYQRQHLFEEGQKPFNLQSLKSHKKTTTPKRQGEFMYQKIQKSEDSLAVKRKLHLLLNQKEILNKFMGEAQQFLGSEEKAEGNSELLQKLAKTQYPGDDFSWVGRLDFQIPRKDVDFLDLIVNKKLKEPPVYKSPSPFQDQGQFTKEELMSVYQRECQRRRLNTFRVESKWMARKSLLTESIEILQGSV